MKDDLRKAKYDAFGAEIMDPIPVAPPLGYVKQPTMAERIRQMVRSEHVRLAAEAAGQESFDEADDFEVGEDYDPRSPYEEVFDPVDAEVRMSLRNAEYRAKVEARLQELQPVKEKEDGASSTNERGSDDTVGESGHSDKKS